MMPEILIYGDIGFEVVPAQIVAQLKECEGPIEVRVDSFGGDVYAGISIMNALRRYPDVVTVYVDGMAASAASYIAVGGADRLVMSPNSSMMVHGAWTQGVGNSAEFSELAANLTQITDNIASIYAEKSGKDKDFWLEVMEKDTTYSAEQAVEIGLADSVAESKKSAFAAQRQSILASLKSRFQETAGRAGVPEIAPRSMAPPPPIVSRSESGNTTTTEPSDGQNGDKMSILNQLAQELGKKPEDVQNALSGFFNEVVPITGEVEVSYPADTKIVPTEKIKVAPIVGDKPAETAEPSEGDAVAPVENAEESAGDSAAVQLAKSAGLTFAMGDVAEGFTAEVDEGGTVTIKAPSGAEVGSTAEFTVLVNETAVPLSVTVRSLDEEEGAEGEDPADAETEPASAGASTASAQFVSVPKAHFDYLNKLAANFGATQAKIDAKAKEDRVVKDIADGRFSASNRADALRTLTEDPKAYENSWGKLPKNTIPRAEIGYGVDPAEGGAKTAPTKNPFSKPKV